MDEPRQIVSEPESRGQKIARLAVWIVFGLAIIGAFGSLFFNR